MVPKDQTLGVRTWIEIDTQAIKANSAAFRNLIGPKVKMMAVVKSNAYGHGLVDFSKRAVEYGADWLGVDSITEGLRLRREGITIPILVLGYTLPEMIEQAVEGGISITVSHLSHLDAIEKLNLPKKVNIHVKVDTGMYRQGFIETGRDEVLKKLSELKDRVEVQGLFTHFSSAKNPAFPNYTQGQIKKFEEWRKAFLDAGYTPIIHAAATSGTILFPEAHYDMVRIGIGMYGLWPSAETKAFAEDRLPLKPVLSWKTVIGETKQLPKGSKISYDGTETLARDSVVAVCPIGYWHGFSRKLSSIGRVLVNGKRAKVLGRVAMDMIVIDLTDCGPVEGGSEVVLIGEQKGEKLTAEDMAYLDETSWYETITRINPLIRKIHF